MTFLILTIFSLLSAISGKGDKESKRRDSLAIQEARMTMSGNAPPALDLNFGR
jgi:hypothetical protein